MVLAEMKSCRESNFHVQIRRGISQILEYGYVYREQLGQDVCSVLVMEIRPATAKHWLLDFVAQLGITVVWKSDDHKRLETTMKLPAPLVGIITQA